MAQTFPAEGLFQEGSCLLLCSLNTVYIRFQPSSSRATQSRAPRPTARWNLEISEKETRQPVVVLAHPHSTEVLPDIQNLLDPFC